MPGLLKPDAACPKCGTDLLAITDLTSTEKIVREYIHQKGSPKARRKRRCLKLFTDTTEAAHERRALEIHA